MTSKAPKNEPLTLCLAPDLDWSRTGVPASDGFGDIYFSVDGGLDETRAVYLSACGLPQRWETPKNCFTICELGFGTGLNFLATWQLWTQGPRQTKQLHFVSIEKYPLSKSQLTRALSHWPELKDLSTQLIAAWPDRVKGIHRLHFGDVTLTLIHDDVSAALDSVNMQADAWYLDGFSPARNPDMWSDDILARIGSLSADGARVGTFTAAGAVRQGLSAAGFNVRKVDGFGRKRHRIEAVMDKVPVPAPQIDTPIIIGAGIAGASLARSFLLRGIVPLVIDAGDDTAASGNPAAIVKPRLDRQDRADSRFFLSSYLYAMQAYEVTDGVLSRGVYHIPKSADERARFEDLALQSPLPDHHMTWVQSHGLKEKTPALYFPKAMIIDPSLVCEAFLLGAKRVTASVAKIKKQGDVWSVLDDGGAVIATGRHVIFAIGAGVRDMAMFDDVGLRFSRGQLTWVDGGDVDEAITYGGYGIGHDGATLLGATHDRLDGDSVYAPRSADDKKNIMSYENITGQKLVQSPRPSRVSVRVNSPQTWPIILHGETGITALTGLGSRGFVFAPLLGEAIVSELCGEPSAIETGLFSRDLSP
ncbi:tRNA (5-methylaminomethyl-2-thiouridine)(34)-methyltransferase MnmD [Fretibacter rubidus]|uniref:tRNA (5-methylaminomethyl-2-thiouridine)(34)-methyltransferase MnmD n=1 Tax=Fretibacter rubidus TaxID=570162 RepID=UPI00352A8A6C